MGSLPAWGAWIEMCQFAANINISVVAPRVGSVD